MAVHLIFRAMTKESHSTGLSEMLEQPQSELLSVIFDPPVSLVDRAAFEQFLQVTPAILRPGDLGRKNRVPQFFARAEIRHPDIVTILRQTAPAPARCQNSQAILFAFDWRIDRLGFNHTAT